MTSKAQERPMHGIRGERNRRSFIYVLCMQMNLAFGAMCQIIFLLLRS